MSDEPRDDDQHLDEQAAGADEATEDLPVRASEADKVKGGAIGPCDRPK